MTRIVELRSDTFTLPTESMRRAMAAAEVGDDVWDEDPTVHRLQERAAAMLGKEAALLVPSGTMGNLCALVAHTRRGEEVILDSESHIVYYEAAGGAVVGGLQYRTLVAAGGRLTPQQVESAIREDDPHQPRTGLLCLENTHNRSGGICLSPAQTAALSQVAHEHGFPVHLDGARIFNAAVALEVPAASLAGPTDSVMFCLSKGLSAPVGSMLAGSAEFIASAHRVRKMLGGGMRQAGVIAAAGLCALEEMIPRLEEDHVNARLLAEGIAGLEGIVVDRDRVETNMVFVDCRAPLTAQRFLDLCQARGVRMDRASPSRVRMVTHRGVSREDVEFAVSAIRDALEAASPRLTVDLTSRVTTEP